MIKKAGGSFRFKWKHYKAGPSTKTQGTAGRIRRRKM